MRRSDNGLRADDRRLLPIIHLGRPGLFYWLAPYPNERGLWPNFRSPLVWDFFAINTYLIGSLIYLYLPLIPDLALLRDKAAGCAAASTAALSLNWRGTELQWDRLERAVRVMAVSSLSRSPFRCTR